jgi:hypothetical protein
MNHYLLVVCGLLDRLWLRDGIGIAHEVLKGAIPPALCVQNGCRRIVHELFILSSAMRNISGRIGGFS